MSKNPSATLRTIYRAEEIMVTVLTAIVVGVSLWQLTLQFKPAKTPPPTNVQQVQLQQVFSLIDTQSEN